MRSLPICAATFAFVAFIGACGGDGSLPTTTPGSAGTGMTTPAGGGSSVAGTSPMPTAGTATGTGGSGAMPIAGTSAGGMGSGGMPGGGMPGGGMPGGGMPGGGMPGGGMNTGGGAGVGLRTGPFKMLVLSTTLEFAHDSIPTCMKMLQDLGMASAPERATIAGLAADATWTVDQINPDTKSTNYFSEVSAANLGMHEMMYSDNPTGPVFTNAPDGANKKMIFQTWFEGGGAWAGQHSATDFENNSRWTWFDDHVAGGWFTDHDGDGTPGTVSWQTQYADHPIVKGLASPWNTSDEWYIMNRDIESVPGFKILGKVTVSNSSKPNGAQPRPAVWVTENAKGGRGFYTIRGHNQKVYAEAEFRQLMLRGILWAVHRLPGGN